MKRKNKVAVIMSVYREDINKLRFAIDSILNQTLKNIELIIVVDDPDCVEIVSFLKRKAKDDDRIKLIINNNNMGLALSLNRGIEFVKDSKYIARMDADDISVLNRLEMQYEFLEKHPDVDLVGCGVYFIDANGKIFDKRNVGPSNIERFKKAMSLVNIMSHPTFFGRTDVFKKFMYRNLRYAQDYDFVCRILEKGGKVINMDDYLLYYRKDNYIKKNNKEATQFITQFLIQRLYSKNRLNATDITRVVRGYVSNGRRFCRIKTMVGYYNSSISLFKNKRALRGLVYLFVAVIGCRCCADRVYKTAKYVLLNKIWLKERRSK